MKRQYTSMQEELAARKAAGEFGDTSEFDRRFRREEPTWYRSSMADADRTRATMSHAGKGRGIGSRGFGSGSAAKASSHNRAAIEDLRRRLQNEGRKTSGTAGSGTAGGRRDVLQGFRESTRPDAGRNTRSDTRMENTRGMRQPAAGGRRRSSAGTTRNAWTDRETAKTSGSLGAILIGAGIFFIALLIIVGSLVADEGNEWGDWDIDNNEEIIADDDYGSVELNGDSGFYDAVDYIESITITDVDEETLENWAYDEVIPAVELILENYGVFEDENGPTLMWDSYGGRLYIEIQCKEGNDPKLICQLMNEMNDRVTELAGEADLGWFPISFILTDYDSENLLGVVVNGDAVFAEDPYAELLF